MFFARLLYHEGVIDGRGVDLQVILALALAIMKTALQEKRPITTERKITSIRINQEVLHLAKVEAVKAKITLGEWLEDAIREKIESKN